MTDSYGLYIHLPFCNSKCPYCSFMSHAGMESKSRDYCDAASRELSRSLTGNLSNTPQTVYIGGGTPSVVPVRDIKTIIDKISLDKCREFSIEANPESIDSAWLTGVKDIGVNRISIGVQSLDDGILKNLGRIHYSKCAVDSIKLSQQFEFSSLSVDLMFGVPGQTLEIWKETLKRVMELEPDHLSCYSLGIEEDTEYYKEYHSRGLDLPDAETTTDMYLFMAGFLAENGLRRYEISNFSRPGYECLHNRNYWNFTPYLGIGASAHSFDGESRLWNSADIETYIAACMAGKSCVIDSETIDSEKKILETIMLSLRTGDGLDRGFPEQLNTECRHSFENIIDSFIHEGYIEKNDRENICLTDYGAVLADEIISEIVCELSA